MLYEIERKPKTRPLADDHPAYIYVLIDPRDETIRYVGCTIDPILRFDAHAAGTNGTAEKARWEADLKANGLMFRMFVVEETTFGDMRDAEKRWIEHYRQAGAPLTNGSFRSNGIQAQASVAVAGAAGKRPATSDATLDPLQIRAAEIVRDWLRRRTR